MIANISSEQDMTIFLPREEIDKLDYEVWNGILITFDDGFHTPLKLGVDDNKTSGNASDYHHNIFFDGFESREKYSVFISTEMYNELKQTGHTGGMGGYGKGDVVEMSNAETNKEFMYMLRNLKLYCKNHRLSL